MAVSKKAKDAIRALMSGKLSPDDEEAIKALAEAFKENPVYAKQMVGMVPKEYLVKAMKVADIPSRKIGDILFDDPLDRADFFKKEQVRARCIGKPGFDEHGYPTGFGLKNPFAAGVTAEAMALDRRRGIGLENDGSMKAPDEVRAETGGGPQSDRWGDEPGSPEHDDDDPWEIRSGPKPKGEAA